MVRRKQPPAGAARIYRHFALVTVFVTALVAMFADGEGRQAMADELTARHQQAQLRAASAQKYGKPKLVRRAASGGGSFGSDGGDFGAPMDDTGVSGTGYIPDNPWSAGGEFVPDAWNHYGLSNAQWSALSADERRKLADAYTRRKSAIGTLARQQQLAGLTDASRARAGAATAAD